MREMKILLLLSCLLSGAVTAQNNPPLQYELDLSRQNDAFNVSLTNLNLSEEDDTFSFVSYAPGVHQPLDFGRFVKLFKAYDKEGSEVITQKISINDFKLTDPKKVTKIVYEIDDTFDMSIDYHPIYPMSGTGITDHYAIVNSHGVFGYFENLKSKPINLSLKLNGTPKVGTALDKNKEGIYLAESYYHLTDSPLLIGQDLSYFSMMIGEIEVEAYAYSPVSELNAEIVLKEAEPILNAAIDFIGYSPVDRYTFLMYFNDEEDVNEMPVLRFGGALEHSYSSTYALPGNSQTLKFLKNVIGHEFMHILSPLYLRSEILASVDYSRPVTEDQHVWLYEGVTEWAAFAMQVRNGSIDFDEYLDYLSKKIIGTMNYSSDYSLTRISREWPTDEGGKQYSNIYQLGSLTAAMLDFKLLQLSDGEKGLQEVYLELIQKYGKDHPFNNDTFFDEFVAMTYPEIEEFIEKHIKNNTPFNFKEEAEAMGLKYIPKRKNPQNLPAMGFKIGINSKGKAYISSLLDEYQGSGLQTGDVILSINEIPLVNAESYQNIMKSINESSVGDNYNIIISRDQAELQLEETLFAKSDYHVFEIDPKASKNAIRLRQRLMSNL